MDVAALRPRIEHAQMIRHVDMARMARLNGVQIPLLLLLV